MLRKKIYHRKQININKIKYQILGDLFSEKLLEMIKYIKIIKNIFFMVDTSKIMERI